MWIFIRFLVIALLVPVLGDRDYCYAGQSCQQDSQCFQVLAPTPTSAPVKGYCCRGTCVQTYPTLARGKPCNESVPCDGLCGNGDSCTNGICTGPLHSECPCTQSSDCQTQNCSSFMCSSGKRGAGAPCTSSDQCSSLNCLNGLCTGVNQTLGFYCRYASECTSGNCKNGVCVLKDVGQGCTATSQCAAGLVCKTALCSQPTALGLNCSSIDECVSVAYCDLTGTKLCEPKTPLGGSCATVPCVTNTTCNSGVCVADGSLVDGAVCTISAACKSTSTCSINAVNGTTQYCIPKNSVVVDGPCSNAAACPPYAACTANKCTDPAKECNPNATVPDSSAAQCGSYSLQCGCKGRCTPVPDPLVALVGGCTNLLLSYVAQPQAIPESMTPAQAATFANTFCCLYCTIPTYHAIPLDTTLAGYIVDCDKKTITKSPACFTDKSGVPLFQGCDRYNNSNNSAAGITNVNGMLLFLFSILFLLFN